jgi:protein-S-isoprenylcysteine O-methyltransferase Ste14
VMLCCVWVVSCGFFLVVLAPNIFFQAPAIILFILGLFIRILAFKEIRSTYRIDRLVTSGIYSRTRNPIYLAFSLMFFALALYLAAALTFLWAIVSVIIFYGVARREEKDLEKAFGQDYLSYKASVPMFIPRWP